MNEKTFNYCLKNIRIKECFDKLFNFYYRRIVIHINGKFKMGALSEDVAQETFIKLLSMESVKHIEYYTSWIYTISENIALRKLGKEKAEQKKLFYEQGTIQEEMELFGELQKEVEKLDNMTRRIFYYYYVEAYKLKEIANLLNLTYANVRQKHSRGIKFLRKKGKVSHSFSFNVFI